MSLPPPDATGSAAASPLEERLRTLIKAQGPISVADYMADALGHPHYGYYMTGAPIGAEGDFTTAPEISQIFGELIGAFLVQSWIDLGEPAHFNLVELGPGRGVMMADILRAARMRPAFRAAAELWLVETSGRLRHEQSRRLSTFDPNWTDRFAGVPAAPTLIVANEFFDCLPIRQFVRVRGGWRERLVGLDDDGARLAFTLAPTPPAPPFSPPEDAPEGAILELCEAGVELAASIGAFLTAHQGRALFIDYGHPQTGLGETLQAVRRHAFWPPLAAPGLADLTAHVDFEALMRAAVDAGAEVAGPVTQGALLARLGIAERATRLAAGKTEDDAAAIFTGASRLSAPEEMGEIFKALVISSPRLPPPPGF